MTDKHVHHYIPKKYLRGFAAVGEKSLIWEFSRDEPEFEPGRKRGRNNPALISLEKLAGAERDGYAYAKTDGAIDSNFYEDKLAGIEQRHNGVIDKIRNREMITAGEKEDFTKYIALTLRRVPARKNTTPRLWLDVVQDFKRNRLPGLLDRLDELIAAADPTDNERRDRLTEQRRMAVTLIEEYKRSGIPRKIELDTLVDSDMKKIRGAITSMRWQFVKAPPDRYFVTSDNPVHIFKGGVGLRTPYSELVLPMSSKCALVASYRDVREGFVPGNGQVVNEINRRVVSQSVRYAYGPRADAWILKLLRKTFHRFELLYSYNDVGGELPRPL
jgi:hypothetical protein